MSVCLSPPTLLVPQSHAFQQSCLSAIMPVGHHAHHTSEFQDLKMLYKLYSILHDFGAFLLVLLSESLVQM